MDIRASCSRIYFHPFRSPASNWDSSLSTSFEQVKQSQIPLLADLRSSEFRSRLL
jgi:hypothetical protein